MCLNLMYYTFPNATLVCNNQLNIVCIIHQNLAYVVECVELSVSLYFGIYACTASPIYTFACTLSKSNWIAKSLKAVLIAILYHISLS